MLEAEDTITRKSSPHTLKRKMSNSATVHIRKNRRVCTDFPHYFRHSAALNRKRAQSRANNLIYI